MDDDKLHTILHNLLALEAPGVLILAVVMLSYQQTINLSEAFDAIDVFAGAARLSFCLRRSGRRTATLDIAHWPSYVRKHGGRSRKSGNPLDLLTAAGFLTLLASILRSKPGILIAAFGLVCSSFVSISQGSTGRSYWTPLGHQSSGSATMGNLLASRTALALLLVEALHGVWVVEQPASSVLMRHPRFEYLKRRLTVWSQAFWMKCWGSPTLKRTKLFSNSRGIRRFRTTPEMLRIAKRKNPSAPKLASTYTDASGKKRYQGNKNLKQSQVYPMQYAVRFASSVPVLLAEKTHQLPEQRSTVDRAAMAHRVMSEADFGDLCEDAGMLQTLEYLYGSTSLELPPEWKASIRQILDGSFQL